MTDVVARARAFLEGRGAIPNTIEAYGLIAELLGLVAPEPFGKLVLPYPISANDMWGSFVPKGSNRAHTYLTPEAKAWKAEAALKAKLAGFRWPTKKPIVLRVVHHHKALVYNAHHKRVIRNGNVFDLDNVLKVSIDGLKKTVFEDDRQVKRIVAEYGPETEKGALVVEVADFVAPQPELFRIEPPEPAGRKDGLPF